jgi:short-subunit dehydrogenase
LKAEPGSHVANISSLFGLIAPARQGAYAASKFAVRGFTEALRHELADNGIGVTSIYPGGIRTRIVESARVGSGVTPEEEQDNRKQFAPLLTIAPARAADIIIDGIERRRGRLLIGWLAKIFDLLARFLPVSYGKILAIMEKKSLCRPPHTQTISRRIRIFLRLANSTRHTISGIDPHRRRTSSSP